MFLLWEISLSVGKFVLGFWIDFIGTDIKFLWGKIWRVCGVYTVGYMWGDCVVYLFVHPGGLGTLLLPCLLVL